MLCPAVSVAVAGCLLTGLGLGLSLPAAEGSQEAFSLCSRCFYRQTPPARTAGGATLQPRCHRLPGGRAFATLHSPTCDTAVYSALRLGHGWPEEQGEGGESVPVAEGEEEEVSVAMTPALFRGDGEQTGTPPPDSPLQRWDSRVTALVRSSLLPRCTSAGGDLYILTGAGGDGCEAGVLWSAACCAAPDGAGGGFSAALLGEEGGGEKAVSVRRLEERLGVGELFSGGCGGTSEETEGDPAALFTEASPGVSDRGKSRSPGGEEGEEEEDAVAGEGPEAAGTEDQDDAVRPTSGRSHESLDSEPLRESDDNETESGSTLVYVLSCSFYLLTAPLRPVVSTIVEFPGQVSYVLQEDLGVLGALPGETLSVFHLLASDVVAGVGSGIGLLLGVGESCLSGLYHCTSSMGGALLDSCQTGLVGMGTLASDTAGILSGTADNAWWLTRVLGGRLWEQGEGYVEAVVSEVGGQIKSVGGGLGHLVWRGGNGVGNVVGTAVGLVTGSVDRVVGLVTEAFGQQENN